MIEKIETNQIKLIYSTPHMWIGGQRRQKWDNEDLWILLKFVIRYSVDVSTLNKPSKLKILLKSEDKIVIEDDGVGLPIKHPSVAGHPKISALLRLLKGYIPTGELTEDFYRE